jgi:hypothetical protein
MWRITTSRTLLGLRGVKNGYPFFFVLKTTAYIYQLINKENNGQ